MSINQGSSPNILSFTAKEDIKQVHVDPDIYRNIKKLLNDYNELVINEFIAPNNVSDDIAVKDSDKIDKLDLKFIDLSNINNIKSKIGNISNKSNVIKGKEKGYNLPILPNSYTIQTASNSSLSYESLPNNTNINRLYGEVESKEQRELLKGEAFSKPSLSPIHTLNNEDNDFSSFEQNDYEEYYYCIKKCRKKSFKSWNLPTLEYVASLCQDPFVFNKIPAGVENQATQPKMQPLLNNVALLPQKRFSDTKFSTPDIIPQKSTSNTKPIFPDLIANPDSIKGVKKVHIDRMDIDTSYKSLLIKNSAFTAPTVSIEQLVSPRTNRGSKSLKIMNSQLKDNFPGSDNESITERALKRPGLRNVVPSHECPVCGALERHKSGICPFLK